MVPHMRWLILREEDGGKKTERSRRREKHARRLTEEQSPRQQLHEKYAYVTDKIRPAAFACRGETKYSAYMHTIASFRASSPLPGMTYGVRNTGSRQHKHCTALCCFTAMWGILTCETNDKKKWSVKVSPGSTSLGTDQM